MKSYLFPKFLIFVLGILFIFFTPTAFAAEARDFDSNAIIFGGALTKGELKDKVSNGTGKNFQSGKELTGLFTTLGMDPEMFDDSNFRDGTVHKNGNVVVNGKVVAQNVKSMGRQNMSGSTKDNRFPYPVYWRNTSVSFRSESLSAFVFMNDDGTMAFAVIKSCGNPVKGVGVKKPVEKKFQVEIKKFNDKDGNGVKDSNEEFLAGWTFKVTGPNGFSKVVVTNSTGSVVLKDLKPGEYNITEVLQSGWTSTTGLTKTVQLKKNEIELFGNKKKEVSPVVKVIEKEKPVEVVKVVEKPVETLPTTGPTKAVLGSVGTFALAGSIWKYRKAKKALLFTLKKL